MRFQRYNWTCGPASVVNVLQCFGIFVPEVKVIPVAGTIPPHKCGHCRKLKELDAARSSSRACSRSGCQCDLCLEYARVRRLDCDAGTSEAGIVAAVRHFGGDLVSVTEYSSENKSHAWEWLHGSLIHGRPAVLCLDSWAHWALAASSLGDRVFVFDPAPSKRNMVENGVHVLTKQQLMRRWFNARLWADGERRLYAVSVGKK